MKYKGYLPITVILLGITGIFSSCEENAAKQMPPPSVEVVNVIQKDVPFKRDFVGQVYGLQDIPIRARVDGFLELINFEEGTKVKKGQLLYKIDAQPYMAEVASQRSKVAESETYLVNAQNELNRYEPLVKINAVSKSDYDAALANKEAAEASLEAAKANLELAEINLSYTNLISPINGIIGKTEARVGEYVGKDPNPVILNTVSKVETVRIQFFLPETDYISLVRYVQMEEATKSKKDRKDSTIVELILADGSLYEHTGNVDFVDRNVDASTGSLLVQASFPNPDGVLRPGMYAKTRLILTTLEDMILIPQRAVSELQGQYSVYIVDENNTVQPRQIKPLDRSGDLWVIQEGLKPDDQVIITGIQKVSAGSTVNPTVVEFESKANQ